MFLDSAIEGLRYQTPTQSGLTNSSGEFQFEQGETVTISVGGITLGSVTGAELITPFDLFNLTAPQTEADVRAILSNYNNLDDFDSLFNMVVFLTSLDNDGNPENGLELTGWDATLASATLSFDHNKNDFTINEFNQFTELFSVKQVKDIATAFSHTINSLNISISVHLRSKQETDNGNNGSVNRVNELYYDEKGRVISLKNDRNNNGNFEQITNTTFNNRGLRSQRELILDNDGSGGLDSTDYDLINYTYNDKELTAIQDIDLSADGSIDARRSSENTYDDNNNVASEIKETSRYTKGDINTPYKVEVRTYEYDALGNITKKHTLKIMT